MCCEREALFFCFDSLEIEFCLHLSLRGYAEAIQNNKILKSKITELNLIAFIIFYFLKSSLCEPTDMQVSIKIFSCL